MLKIITSILILLNPLAGLLSSNQPIQNASQPEAPLFVEENHKLPLTEDIFLAAQFLPIYPIRNWNVDEPDIPAQTAMIFETSRHLILFQKNGINDARPIASLTKMMTALVVLDNAGLGDVFKVSKEAIQTNGEQGDLRVGEEISVENLLYALLVESSNDAAVALAQNIQTKTGKDFVGLMNQKAKELKIKSTSFADPSGLDPQNRSSAWDLAQLLEICLKNPSLARIMQTSQIQTASADGRFVHYLKSTNHLLGKLPDVAGGKTGYTEEAGNCMVLAVSSPNNEGLLISVVMGAQDRMGETETLINWTKKAFFW